jgi:hypothetical protein
MSHMFGCKRWARMAEDGSHQPANARALQSDATPAAILR